MFTDSAGNICRRLYQFFGVKISKHLILLHYLHIFVLHSLSITELPVITAASGLSRSIVIIGTSASFDSGSINIDTLPAMIPSIA
jgi:hypothetical protein